MKNVKYFSLLLVMIISLPGHAYELAAHGRLTYEAYKLSVLKPDSDLARELGVKDIPTFGTSYYDIFENEIKQREKSDFEQGAKRMPEEVDPLSLPGWLLRGAIREDDWTDVDLPNCHVTAPNPQDDPYTDPPDRPRSHFYDPYYNRALTWAGITLGKKAPDWALGVQDAFAQAPVPDDSRRNHFTVLDAREAMYRALTGKTRDGNDAGPNNQPATEAHRKAYWATLFRALGDIVHLVQDMAQPQHTRNDRHAGVCVDLITGHASLYEAYTDCRATNGQIESIDNHQDYYIDGCDNLTYTGYPIPVFTKYSDYFATRDGTGRGLAEYSNRNFFTFRTNLGNNDYPSPSNDRSRYTEESAEGLVPVSFRRTVKFLRGDVADAQTGETSNIRLTTESAFDYFLGTHKSYSLNKYNYDDQANLLIPRAVAYSAGLINYFFRGRIEAEDAHYTDTGIDLKVKNAIDPDTAPEEWQNEKLYAQTSAGAPGTLRIAYEYKDENDITRFGVSDSVDMKVDSVNGDDDIAPGEVSREIYSFPLSLPAGTVRGLKYRLVFRGRLGNEDDAVVAGVFHPASGFLVQPSITPADGITGARMIYKTSSGWKLAPDEGLAAGNIDWKGWYEGNPAKPTKVLSWMGPTSRYFAVPVHGGLISADPVSETEENVFAPEIYQDGEILSVAPFPVLGAALAKDADNKIWIVAVCRENGADVFYRRPYKKSTSPAIYDPVTAKDGWQTLGRSTPAAGDRLPDVPWFFRGDGKQAQTMRKWIDPNDPQERVQFKRLVADVDIDTPNSIIGLKTGDPTGFVTTTQCVVNYDADGAGTGSITDTETGSYVIAVDYDDMNEVLAVVNEDNSSNKTTTVTVVKDADGNITSRKTSTTQSEHADASLLLDGTEIPIVHSSYTNTDGNSSDQYRSAVINYYLDLRKKLYVYYEEQWDQSEQKVDAATVSGAGNYAESMHLEPEQPSGLFTNTYSYSYTNSIELPTGVFSCAASYPVVTRYETSFGSVDNVDIGGGGWAVDSDGNVLVSQKFYSDSGYQVHDAFNYLKDGVLNEVTEVVPDGAAYYPVEVLH